MTDKDVGVRSVALGLLAALIVAGSAQAAPKVSKPTGAPASIAAGGSFTVSVKVKGKASGKVALVLSKDKKADKKDVKVGTLKFKKRKPAKGKVTVPANTAAGTYKLIACLGKKCATGKAIKVTRGSSSGGDAQQPPPARPSGETVNLPPAPKDPVKPNDPQKPTDPAPQDPEKVAPPLDPGAATSVYDSTKFLYSGANPIQRGVQPGAIEPEQVAVLRGKVTDRAGAPIKDVLVTVLEHPELGYTRTRADGEFDIAVNGGGLTLSFEAGGFLPVQRTLAPNWQDYETLDDIVMVPVDPNATKIDPNSNAPFQVVQGTETHDKDGERQGTLLVPKGTDAVMELPNGTTKAVNELKIRITEFTYGDQGDNAMPGTLPVSTGYTYAAEFSVDEALKAGATEVRFDQPLINYTENFIGAPVGSPVPTGYYDRERGEWVASKNGRVIEVLAGGGVDTDGDGKADTGLNITDAERQRLAALYAPGQELWRVEITHFTPWDHNWPYGPPPGARPPQLKEFEWKDPNDPCRQKGSTIGCETQTLGESLPLTGTGMSLNYSSDRTPGWRVDEALEIPIVGAVPPRLKGIQLTIDVAGERFEKRWCDPNFPTTGASTCKDYPPITPNIKHTFRWDGFDAYNRPIQGRVTAKIRVVYVYEFNYYGAPEEFESSFSQFGSDTEVMDGRFQCGNVSGSMETHFFCGIPVGQTITRALGSWDARPTHGLGGWSLSDHHAYDPVERALHRGDGSTIRADALPPVVRTLAGTRTRGVGGGHGAENFPKDGEDAAGANIDYLGDYVRSPDGNLYLYNGLNRNDVFRVSRDGKIFHFAGNGTKGGNPTGDGGPAKDAGLGTVSALATTPDGALLIAGYGDNYETQQIRRVSPDGSKIETIAGNTNRQAPLGDGKPAREAHLGLINDMVGAPDGSIYWVERYSAINGWKGRLRRIGPDGIVTTVAGAGDIKPNTTGTPAADIALGSDPRGVALGPDGSIYVALGLEKAVVKIAPDGTATRFAGRGVRTETGTIEFGAPAAESFIDAPYSVAVANDGSVYIRSLGDVRPSGSAILKVDEDGILQQHGGRLRGMCGAGAPDGEGATSVCIQNHSTTLGVDPDGGVTFADGRYLIRKITPPLPGFDPDGLALPSPDGLEVYEFDRNGRHLRTRDGITGAVTKTFEYDAAKRLIGVVDPFGKRTRIERDGSGVATAIVAPGGQRAPLVINNDGWLESVRDHRLSYHPGGLLATYKRPEGGTTRFDYDTSGRLIRHRGADGDERTLHRTETDSGTKVTIKTAGGRETVYSMDVLPNGDRRRTVQTPSGAKTTSTQRVDGITELVDADGTATTIETAPDPRWGATVPILAEQVITTPDGKSVRTRRSDTVSLRDPRDPFSVNELRRTFTEGDNKISTWTYRGSDRTITTRSAENRETVTTLDAHARVVKQTLGTGVAPLEYSYDELGRPRSIKQGAEVTTFGYDAKHRLVSSTDAAGHAVTYTYDDEDRIKTRTLPGNRTYTYGYDGNGNVESITTPRGKVHRFDATDGDRAKSYTPPGASPYVRAYSTEKQLESVTLPSGALADMGYDAAGRLTSEDHVQTKRTFGYDGDRDRFATIERELANGTGKQTLAFGHDGHMPKSVEFGGVASGRYDYTLGDRLLPGSETLTVGDTEITRALEFDGDRLLKKTGPFTIERSGPVGSVSKITDGKLTLSYSYDANGRPATRTLSVGGTERFFQKLTFDKSGRAEKREERVDGVADTVTYTYDGAGQLLTVKRGNELLENHTYDGNGNRLTGGAAYDDQDRLTTGGYTWDADGFLKTRGNDTFTYSRNGELLSANGVTYSYDGLGRRTAAGDTKYLYGNPANPFQVTATVTGGVVTTYYYDADDRVFALEREGERYYVGTDAVGSPRIVVRASDGAVVRRVDYDAFGAERNVTGTFELPLGFAGGLRDATTGLVRFGLRDYDPAIGRFVARDPIFFEGSPENLYVYANNNPITLKDPTGLSCISWAGYATFGGGIQLCRDNKIENADWSICVEAGVGAGGGFEADLAGSAASTGVSVFAEASAKLGMVGATIGGELDLGCMNGKAYAKGMYGFGTVGVDTTGAVFAGGGQNSLPTPGFKLEGKIGIKGCKRF
ncbi:MAG TPA: RHS repeat-associated core domain-containing protein [Solirubrobacter sp.]|nr:RHS repeat-associated core domain-containing protein [Solirubrobacter sp.]